jgi:hypothetical protein
VWGVWLGMTAWLAVFIRNHVHNLPMNDEWHFVPTYYAGWREKLAWLFEQHCEHRFIVGRAVLLGLYWVTGINFRVGSFATVVILSVASAALILAARKLRGKTSPADLIFPLLLLHLGHTENLVLGYQVVFTLTVMYLSLFALLVAYSTTIRPATSALLGAVLLVPISMGGGQGLAFVLALWCWVVWQTLRGLWTGPRFTALLAAFMAIAVAGYAKWIVDEQLSRTDPGVLHNSPEAQFRIATSVLSMAVGPVGMDETPGVGLGVLIADSLCVIVLLALAIFMSRERAIAGGLLGLLGGVFAFALAIGQCRENGWCSRFAAFSAMGPAVIALTVARFVRSTRLQALWFVIVLLGGITMTWANAVHGNVTGEFCDATYKNIQTDVAMGVPIDLFSQRHVRMWDDSYEGWQSLWAHRFKLVAWLPGPYTGAVIPVAFIPDKTPDPNTILLRNCFGVVSPTSQKILAVRIVFRVSAASCWESMHFMWVDAMTGELKIAEGMSWIRPGRDETMVFIIRGPIKEGRVFMGRKECPADLLRVEFLPMQTP